MLCQDVLIYQPKAAITCGEVELRRLGKGGAWAKLGPGHVFCGLTQWAGTVGGCCAGALSLSQWSHRFQDARRYSLKGGEGVLVKWSLLLLFLKLKMRLRVGSGL